MKNNYYLLWYIVAFLTIPLRVLSQELPKIRINPEQVFGGSVSDYFEDVEYIPLATTPESLFGDIAHLVITDSSIVIADYDTKCVLFFTLSGKFISKAKTKQANTLPSISYDIGNKMIIISEYNYVNSGSEERYFSVNGKELRKKNKTNDLAEINLIDDYFVKFNSCFFSNGETPKDSIHYLLNIYKGANTYKNLLPYNQKNNVSFCRLIGAVKPIKSNEIKNGEFYITTPYDYNLYKINKDTATKLYQFVFPATRTLPASELRSENLPHIDSVKKATHLNSNFIVDVGNIYFHKNLILFKINTSSYFFNPSSSKETQYNFIYEIDTKKIASLERITPDKNNFFLPILGNGITATVNGLIFKDGSYYSSLSSLQMFSAHTSTKSKSPQYPPLLLDYFKTQTGKSNPVIVRMKLKD